MQETTQQCIFVLYMHFLSLEVECCNRDYLLSPSRESSASQCNFSLHLRDSLPFVCERFVVSNGSWKHLIIFYRKIILSIGAVYEMHINERLISVISALYFNSSYT